MSFKNFLKRVHQAVIIVAKIVDVITETLNSPDGKHHTNASIGLARKHLTGLILSVKGTPHTLGPENIPESLKIAHNLEGLWVRRAIGILLIHLAWEDSLSSLPSELENMLTSVEDQLSWSMAQRTKSSIHDHRTSEILVKLERMADLVEVHKSPVRRCHNSCSHLTEVQCLYAIEESKVKMFDLRYAWWCNTMGYQMGSHEISYLEEIVDDAIEIMRESPYIPVSMFRHGHCLGTPRWKGLLSMVGLKSFIAASNQDFEMSHHIYRTLHAAVLLVPFARSRKNQIQFESDRPGSSYYIDIPASSAPSLEEMEES